MLFSVVVFLVSLGQITKASLDIGVGMRSDAPDGNLDCCLVKMLKRLPEYNYNHHVYGYSSCCV